MAMLLTSPSDVSRGIERMPVRLDPTADHEHLSEASDFVYTLCNIPGPSIPRDAFEEQIEGCHCGNVSSCGQSCTCVSRYGRSYDKDGIADEVIDPYDKNQKPIFECNNSCPCSKTCHNRVVQGGVSKELEIFKTREKGFGLRSIADLKKNTFVCEYAGEILTIQEAKQRSKLQESMGSYYILTVREHIVNDKVLTTYIDPMYIGNAGRFINHSCDPNLYMLPVRVNNNVPRVGLFALRDIKSGEELTFDYSGSLQVKGAESGQGGDVEGKRRSACSCQSDKCSGYLPYDEGLFDD